eukprot:NODE_382_length_9640_cov_0.243476.p3 type:complete len:448 gc:universal NODE_382_length_9640_cov_0.243476:1966-623(-)
MLLNHFKRLAHRIIKVPSMGDSISEGTLKSYNKKVGDFVGTDDEVAVVETDKVDVPINSAFSGRITKLMAAEESVVLVGQDLVEIDIDGKVSESAAEPPKSMTKSQQPEAKSNSETKAASSSNIEILKVPSLADSISEGVLRDWLKKEGDHIRQDEQLTSVETDKVDVPINSPFSGKLRAILAEPGSTVAVGQKLAEIEPGDVPATPEIQNLGSQKLSNSQDAKAPIIEKTPSKSEQSAPKPVSKTPFVQAASSAFTRAENRVKITRMRQKIAERLKESQNTAASLTTFNEVDMSNLMRLRKNYKEAIHQKYNVKFGFMSAFLKASALAMKDIPEVNAILNKEEVVYRDYVDISFAVATPKGLVTPVIRNCESKSLIDIEKEVAFLGEKAKMNQITLEDLAGGTFTVSNGGVFGSLYGTPIINLPQSAILGMHAIKERPIVELGQVL